MSNYIADTDIVLVIASKEGIYALERAKKANIPTKVYNKNNHLNLHEMFEEIITDLKTLRVDYIVLAGYLYILTKNIISAYPNKIINIHPSLIPKFCGDGYYGMRVHRAVIEAKENKSGATVHFVDEGTDTGEIILQDSVKVYNHDTPETLAKRVLELEHKLLPRAINKILTKRGRK